MQNVYRIEYEEDNGRTHWLTYFSFSAEEAIEKAKSEGLRVVNCVQIII